MTLGAHFIDERQLRERIAEAGRRAVGLGSTGAPERQRAYEDWLFPHPDDAAHKASMADGMYSCGLNARSCLRASGVDAPELSAPYSKNIGSIFAWLTNVAKRMGAFVDLSSPAKVDAAPWLDVGDVVIVSGPDHVIVLTDDMGDETFRTSEGGRPEAGPNGERGMCIHSRIVKPEVRSDGRLWIAGLDDRTGQPTKGRRAEWAINARWLQTREGES